MLPTLIKIGPVGIHSYGVMMATGFLVALYVMRRNALRAGLDPDVIADAAFWTLLIGLAGTRVLHIIMHPEYYSLGDPLGWIAVWRGGLVFQGAFPVGMLFLYFYLRKKGLPYWRTLDIASPAMAICHSIGRIGCFLNGCCFGMRTDLPWGIPFRRVPWDTSLPVEGSPAFQLHCVQYGLSAAKDHWSFPVHPTQLYSSLALFFIFLLLMYLLKKHHLFDGFVMCTYVAVYSIFRFFNEFLRGDQNPSHFSEHLSDQQFFCILSVVIAGAFLVMLWRYSKREGQAVKPA
ncbi:MAG: prolipoprotein diacylglyceryl transferase [Candidatus Hydrogenedentes bacterium]|nr:prolipoprotein diacylglyceryl transferase [Candidatus Hydrogenedentota bacterium]